MSMASGKHLLVAGGGYADTPMIIAAKRLGFHVTTSGNRAEDMGHAHADAIRLADFSDKDAMLQLAKELSVDAILASCNDFSAISCAYVAERLGLPGHDPYDTALTIHHKNRYRRFAQMHGIASPRAVDIRQGEDPVPLVSGLRLPILVKPIDLTGGKGISLVESVAGINAAVELALSRSRVSTVVAEEFLQGSRHGFSCLIDQGQVVFHFNDDEHYYLNPYLVCAASAPSSAPQAEPELVANVERIAALLNLVDGIVHVQYILHDNRPVIIEICRRPPGDLYPELVRMATGVDYPELIVRAATGIGLPELTQPPISGHHLRQCLMADKPGIFDGVDTAWLGTHRARLVPLKHEGDRIDDPLVEKAGIVFSSYDSRDALLQAERQMPKLIRVRA